MVNIGQGKEHGWEEAAAAPPYRTMSSAEVHVPPDPHTLRLGVILTKADRDTGQR